jgi:hypothetical protein
MGSLRKCLNMMNLKWALVALAMVALVATLGWYSCSGQADIWVKGNNGQLVFTVNDGNFHVAPGLDGSHLIRNNTYDVQYVKLPWGTYITSYFQDFHGCGGPAPL